LKRLLLAALAILAMGASPARAGDPFVVNETGDESDSTPDAVCDVSADPGSQCTLRAAIESANAFPGFDSVQFEIPGPGVQTIAPQTPLPNATGLMVVNGYTQDGAATNTNGFPLPITAKLKVFLDGKDLSGFTPGLRFDPGSAGSLVTGLAIGNFPGAAIRAEVPMTVRGNFLGTNAAGTRARPNSAGFFGSPGAIDATVGGPDFEHPNLISGNAGEAIVTNADLNAEGNYMGTERDGKSPLPNTTEQPLASILLAGDGSDLVQRNIIANSSGPAISIPDANAGSLLSGNRMFGNDGIGIDLGDDGVTPNDGLDNDSGPNTLQNFPVITSALRTGDTTTVEGVMTSVPNESFGLQFFQAAGRSRQGKVYLGSLGTSTGPNGELPFSLEFAKPKKGKFVTATATRNAAGDDGATSEFAKPKKVR
jgi:CSLREA domain-containing protein